VRITYDPAKRAATLSRFISAGYLRGRMVVIVWTPRGNARHIISMRYCHDKEEEYWHAQFGS
jgi:uncharacterized protein